MFHYIDHQRAQSCALWDIFRTFLLLILTSRSNTQTILFGHWFVLFTCRTICLFIMMPLVTNDSCPYPQCVSKSEITLTTFLSAEKDHWVTALHSLGWWKTSRTHWSSIATPPSTSTPQHICLLQHKAPYDQTLLKCPFCTCLKWSSEAAWVFASFGNDPTK